MSENPRKDKDRDFSELANDKRPSLLLEFWYFVKHNKKWWLLPILIILLILAVVALLSGKAIAPFIYPLF
jgi:hypothetical protein